MGTTLSSLARIVIIPPVDLVKGVHCNLIAKEQDVDIDPETMFPIRYPTLQMISTILIREGVHEILVPYNIKNKLDNLSKVFFDRIRIIDKKEKMLMKVGNFLQPIFDETVKDPYGEDIPSSLHSIFNLLYILTLASKEYAFAGEYTNIDTLNDLKKLVKSTESKAVITTIEGILKTYNHASSDILVPNLSEITVSDHTSVDVLEPTQSTISISERIEELLEDAEIRSLQQSRYLLGIPEKIKKGLKETKRYVRRLSAKRKYKNLFKSGMETINLSPLELRIASRISNAVSEIMDGEQIKYNPPIVNPIPLYESAVPLGKIPLYLSPAESYIHYYNDVQ